MCCHTHTGVAIAEAQYEAGERQQTGGKKNPNLARLGASTIAPPLAPFPSKGSPVENQVGFLARGSCLLSAPSQGTMPQWCPQISFRSQLRGSDGFAPSSLLTASGCEATWLSSTSKLLYYANIDADALSRRKPDDYNPTATRVCRGLLPGAAATRPQDPPSSATPAPSLPPR